ncbi:methyl-accepting chemotaxis protein [Candidatus Kuenenia sp.]|uniref:methyl-accepting chemotaxis protein n=1 Tax=Candidatus Kuenenia sp. TaxID=2499824 RepID=UPI00321FEEF9
MLNIIKILQKKGIMMFGKMTIMTRLIVTIVISIAIGSGILSVIVMKREKTQMLEEVKKEARMAADQLISVRHVITTKQHAINNDSKGNFEFKGVIPAVIGREVAEHFSHTTIYKMKQTSLQYRNPANKPDAWETKQLERFAANPDLEEVSEMTSEDWDLRTGTEIFRLMIPLKITEACLVCHGDPATSPTGDGKDISGRQMEGYKLGEIRGGISVVAPMDSINAAIAANRNFSIVGNGIYVLLISGVVFFVTKGVVSLLKRMIHHLNAGAEEVAAASSQISSSSQSLADGASQQAASVEETSASIEEMSSMTAKNADNAEEASHLTVKARSSAEEGNDTMKSLQAIMRELHGGNNQILAIIKSIDEIAFQTNLLALNAAVEAARAGEHGKGFAVVADEVRNLAQRCATASKETADLINARVQSNDNALKITEVFAEKLKEIATDTKKVADLMGEISAASREQSEGVSQIGKAMTSIDNVTQQNAANAEQMASASEELSSQSVNLREVVLELAAQVGGIREEAMEPEVKKKTSLKKEITYHRRPALEAYKAGGSKGRKHVRKNDEGESGKKPEDIIPMDDEFSDF